MSLVCVNKQCVSSFAQAADIAPDTSDNACMLDGTTANVATFSLYDDCLSQLHH